MTGRGRGTTRIATVIATAIAAAAPGPTAADPCRDHIDDPVAVPWRDAGFDAHRGGCLHADLAVRMGGHALIDTPDFYGTLGGDLTISVRLLESEHLEWGLSLRALDGVFVQNAVVKVTELGYGPVTGHLALGRSTTLAGRPLATAALLAVELPYTRARLDGSSGAAQLAGAATWELRPRLRLHGRLALLGWYGASIAGHDTRGAVAASADASGHLTGWLAVTGGLDLQAGWYGLGLDHLAARAGAHWRIRGLWRAELAIGAPVLGSERTNLAFALGVRRDLD